MLKKTFVLRTEKVPVQLLWYIAERKEKNLLNIELYWPDDLGEYKLVQERVSMHWTMLTWNSERAFRLSGWPIWVFRSSLFGQSETLYVYGFVYLGLLADLTCLWRAKFWKEVRKISKSLTTPVITAN